VRARGPFAHGASRLSLIVALAATAAGCAGMTGGSGSSGSASPPDTASRAPRASTRPVDPKYAERLQRVMTPLIKATDTPPSEIKIGIVDDERINAGSAGNGQFIVTRGLLERANDKHLAGVLAHEIAHDDLNHVAKAQILGTGLNVGMVILDQIFPGSGLITPIAGQLVMNRYTQSEEYAADRRGMEILQKAGQSPDIMAETLTWLMQTEGGGSGGGFFSTHPATGDRIEALRRAR
jgi:predicted Zn-dependent protease